MTNTEDAQHGAQVRAALERIRRWLTTHGATQLAENLAPGATPERLDQAEGAFGCALPAELRALWSTHDGSIEDGNGFIDRFNLLTTT